MMGFKGRPGFTGPQGMKGEELAFTALEMITHITEPQSCCSLDLNMLAWTHHCHCTESSDGGGQNNNIIIIPYTPTL